MSDDELVLADRARFGSQLSLEIDGGDLVVTCQDDDGGFVCVSLMRDDAHEIWKWITKHQGQIDKHQSTGESDE